MAYVQNSSFMEKTKTRFMQIHLKQTKKEKKKQKSVTK